MIQKFLREEDAQTLVEYGLLIAFVALVVIAAVTLFGTKIKNNLYQNVINQVPT